MTEAHLKQKLLIPGEATPTPTHLSANCSGIKLCKKKLTRTDKCKANGKRSVKKMDSGLNSAPLEAVISSEVCSTSLLPANCFCKFVSNTQMKQDLLLQTVYNLSEGKHVFLGLDILENFQPVLRLVSSSEEQIVSFNVNSWKQFLSCKDLIIQFFMTCEEWVIESICFPYHSIQFSQVNSSKLLIISDRLQNISISLSNNVALLLLKIDFLLTYILESLNDLQFFQYIKCFSTNLKEYESKLFSEMNSKQLHHSCTQAAYELYLFFWEYYIKSL